VKGQEAHENHAQNLRHPSSEQGTIRQIILDVSVEKKDLKK